MTKKLINIQKKLKKAMSKRPNMTTESNDDVAQLVNSCTLQVRQTWNQQSFQRIFWEQQLKYNSLKNPKSMRWHPLIIKWAMHIKCKSTAAYDAMREIGFIHLPSKRTLFNYSNFIKDTCGLSNEALKHLKSEAVKKGLLEKDYLTYVGILFDEVKIKEDLVYNKHTG